MSGLTISSATNANTNAATGRSLTVDTSLPILPGKVVCPHGRACPNTNIEHVERYDHSGEPLSPLIVEKVLECPWAPKRAPKKTN